MESQGDGVDTMWDELLGAAGTSQLPGDLMIQILVRLPIVSILRFKSVCKAWFALFKSPPFIQQHDHILMSNRSRLSLLVHTRRGTMRDSIFSHLLEQSCGNYVKKNIHFSFEGKLNYIQVVGSIKGLVCLNFRVDATSIVLWNPATRKHFQIPNPELVLGSNECVTMGFAYDQETDCYKVVRVLYLRNSFSEEPLVARIEIYSTRTNAWRTTEIVDFLWLIRPLNCGVVVSGVPYWFAPKTGSNLNESIVWFDASAEIFRFHPLPPANNHNLSIERMEAIGEHPVVMTCEHRPLDGEALCVERVHIRKLTKFDDGGTVSFRIEKFCIQLGSDFKYVIGFWKNGDIIARGKDDTLLLCGQEGNKHLANFESGSVLRVYNYYESLVWPSGLA